MAGGNRIYTGSTTGTLEKANDIAQVILKEPLRFESVRPFDPAGKLVMDCKMVGGEITCGPRPPSS